MEKEEGLGVESLHLEGKHGQSVTMELEAGGGSVSAGAGLSEGHRSYLLNRHGTLHLDPLPSDDPNEPYNWPRWKVGVQVSSTPWRLC